MTWRLELAFVAAVLATVFILTGHEPREALGTLAVILSFCHAQVSDRMAEREAKRSTPDVHCYRWSLWYFLAKEATWFFYFLASGSWSALAGVFLFMAYPFWRRLYRKYFPLV